MSLQYVAMLNYTRETAQQTAEYMIDAARNSDEPVVFVTGNSYMPPARWFAGADEIYGTDLDLWDLYWTLVELKLHEANVYAACPDYDNAIYVVDMDRWEYVDGEADAEQFGASPFDPDSLNGEYRPIVSRGS